MAKKKGNNEGTISQRKDGRWEARVSLGYSGGKLRRKCFYGKTRQEVASKLASALVDVQRGNAIPDDRITVASFLATWLDSTARARLRTSTFYRYETLIKKYVTPYVGKTAVSKLTPAQLQRHWKVLADEGLSGRTIIQIRAVLRTALNQAVRHGMVNRNAAALTDAPKGDNFKPCFLSPAEAESLLAAIRDHKLEALITLAITTGMRIGEILGLTWSDIDLQSKFVTICRQQQRVGKELLVCDPKTERSARTIPLTDLAVSALSKHHEWQIAWLRENLAEGMMLSGRVFTNESGAPLENSTVLRQFQRLCKDKGLPRMRLHDLRHSCATLLLSRGIHPRVVMELLGHSTIAMTMNVYSHVVPEIARGAADAMDAVFAGKTGTNDQK